MNPQHLRERFGLTPAESTFGRNAEVSQMTESGLRPAERDRDAVLQMDQAEKDLGVSMLEIAQWREVGVVFAGDRDGQMHSIDAPPGIGDREVSHPHRQR